jgi:hypothetical protein
VVWNVLLFIAHASSPAGSAGTVRLRTHGGPMNRQRWVPARKCALIPNACAFAGQVKAS